MTAKTERITILGTTSFKRYLMREAKKEGISLSEFVRQRCEDKPSDKDEELLLYLVNEVKESTKKAKKSLDAGLKEAERVMSELRS